MKVAVFSAKPYDCEFLSAANARLAQPHQLTFYESKLNETSVQLVQDCLAVCCFVNDRLNAQVLQQLADRGVKLIALRCAGFNHVDLDAANKLNITVKRVPDYSPHAVAEHALGLILMLNRNLHRAYHRIRENDYALNGLMGFDLYKKKVGVVGLGKIGSVFANIMQGIGCKVLGYDPQPNSTLNEAGIHFVNLEKIWQEADIISLHCPLTNDTHHMINAAVIEQMKQGVMLINTSRGGLIDTKAIIVGLKNKKIGYLGLDVYEEESDLFFENKSNQLLQDDIFARLLTFPNVVITGHQAFFTREAMTAISQITVDNITHFENSIRREKNE
jgi:D-lactate dehydrogenase